MTFDGPHSVRPVSFLTLRSLVRGPSPGCENLFAKNGSLRSVKPGHIHARHNIRVDDDECPSGSVLRKLF